MSENPTRDEYERIKALFAGCEENQLSLLDGAFWECARMRVELNRLNEIVKESGHIRVSAENPQKQAELPASKVLTKVRANYLNYIAKLSNILGKIAAEEENDLEEFE